MKEDESEVMKEEESEVMKEDESEVMKEEESKVMKEEWTTNEGGMNNEWREEERWVKIEGGRISTR